MDFLDPKKKRSYNIRLALGFVLIAIALILGTTILALITAGYGFDSKTGKIIQNGLVFINSQPASAKIYVNNTFYGNTNARLELPAGNYTFTLVSKGYHNWTNTSSLFGGSVDQLIYPFLFPSNPQVSNVLTFSSEPNIVTESPDRHWLLASIPGQTGVFSEVDLTNRKAPITTVAIPATIFANQPGDNVLKVVQWSTDNKHLLLQDNYQGGVSYIMLDRSAPTNTTNVSKTLVGTDFTDIRLDNNQFDQLYLYDANTKTLSLADTTTKVVTPVLQNVLSYWPYGTNDIVYTTPLENSTTSVKAMLLDKNTSYLLRLLPISTSYQLNMATYNGDTYIIIGGSSSDYAYIYMNPLDSLKQNPQQLPLPATMLVSGGTPQNVTFSASARFIALQSGSQFSVYDLMTQTHYRYDTGLPLLPNEEASWMDGNRLVLISGNRLVVFDFDGTNTVNFVPSSNDFNPLFTQGYDAVYTVSNSSTSATPKWVLQRNSLVVGQP